VRKKSRLSEKGTRMPEIRQGKWERAVPAYLESVGGPGSESAKSHRFAMLLGELFGEQPGFIEEYVEGIEKYVRVKEKDRILRGRVDNLFGNLIIEFEQNLQATGAEAEDQLRKYVACVWSDEAPGQRRPYLAIAGDGIHFAVYSPSAVDPARAQVEPDDIELGKIEEVDFTDLEPADVYFWLDRYFRRKEILPPTTENIVSDFGVKSHAFQVASASLLSLWRRLEQEPQFAVVYESWSKYLLIVYGSSVADDELFIRHTYLATLAKLMAWCRLAEATTAAVDELALVLEGEFFKGQGIENFLEEDFFSWLVRDQAREIGIDTARMLFSLLQNYNLRELSEDVLKSLYQELVDPETRHDLGEFYTPDWLAHRIVRKLLDEKPKAKMLDPACGSGTFLYLAITEKRERLGDSLETLKHIQESVVGVDIHPLAVIVAKTNYILALGDLRKKGRRIAVPIYLADTLWPPERFMKGPNYDITLDSSTVFVHEGLLESSALYDQAIELAREFARENKGKTVELDVFRRFLLARQCSIAEDETLVESLFQIAEVLRKFIDADRDTIWAFVLKNRYKPLFLKSRFDFVMGNPPWIAFRYMEPAYQTLLKGKIVDEYKLLAGRGELITHLEVATLFLLRAVDLYLRKGGVIAFVLPRSIFAADQHDDFRQAKFVKVELEPIEIWDLEGVSPLFKVPASVLFMHEKEGARFVYPISGLQFGGQLERRNTALREAEQSLEIEKAQFSLSKVGKRSFWSTAEAVEAPGASYYARRFRQGATIVPRSLWFVQVKTSPLGFDASLPPLETAQRARQHAKDAYRDLAMQGNVESRFLYATLLSTDVLPFGYLGHRLVVLPIEPSGDAYRLVRRGEARWGGLFHLGAWLEKAQAEWARRRGDKAERMTIYERLDRVHGLTQQKTGASYRVLYPKSATHLCAVVLEPTQIRFRVGDQSVEAQGFVADHVTYCMETDMRGECYYLASVLNSPVVDLLIKPLQSRGQWGARDIHKKVLELPIPRYDESNAVHLELARLGIHCTDRVQEWLDGGGPGKVRSIGRLRAMVREMLAEELREIDEVVEPMLRGD
jgi:hypothetical protein